MKSLIIIFTSINILFFSCNSETPEKEILINGFNENKTLIGEFIYLDSLPACPSFITVLDSIIVVMDLDFCSSSAFYIYKKSNLKLLASFGLKGKGPNEFLTPDYPVQTYVGDDYLGIWLYDLGNYKNRLININSSIKSGKTIIEKEYLSPKAIISGIGLITLNNNDILGTSMSQEGRLFYFDNKQKKVTKWVKYFPEVPHPPVKEQQMHNLYTGPIRINPDGSKLVSALYFFKQIDVFDIHLNKLFSLTFPDSPKEPKCFTNPDNWTPDNCMTYYTDLYLTDKYIYALNLSMSYGQSDKNDNIPSEIHVFTYDGLPVRKYTLDRFVGKFTIDEENGYLYGLTYPTDDRPNDLLLRYKL